MFHFYNTLNTFYLYGVAHMVKDNSDNQRNNPLLPFWGYSLWLTATDLLHADWIVLTMAFFPFFFMPVVELWLERETCIVSAYHV